MTSLDIITTYQNDLEIISEKGINYYRGYIKKQKKKLSLDRLTIASSIIAVFDILEKK